MYTHIYMDTFVCISMYRSMNILYIYIYMHKLYLCFRIRVLSLAWPLHTIGIPNIVWCIAYTYEVGRGVVYCPMIVQ